jgi:hypothetical protein
MVSPLTGNRNLYDYAKYLSSRILKSGIQFFQAATQRINISLSAEFSRQSKVLNNLRRYEQPHWVIRKRMKHIEALIEPQRILIKDIEDDAK